MSALSAILDKAAAFAERLARCLGMSPFEVAEEKRAAYHAADKGGQYGALDLSPHALGLELRALKRAQALLAAAWPEHAKALVAALSQI